MGDFDIHFANVSFKMANDGGVDLVAQGIANGTFEAPLPILVMALLSRLDGAFLDVGANTGLYSILAGAIKPGVRIDAFEPFPTAINICRRNARLNNLNSTFRLHECALSNVAGEAALYVPDQSHGFVESSASLESTFKDNITEQITVPVYRLDDLELNHKISVIKVDIEGHEHAFLEGGGITLARNRPVIFLEILPKADMAALSDFKTRHGLIDFRLRPDMAVISPKVKFDPLAWNHAFVPSERIPVFLDACVAHDIEVVTSFI